MIDQFDQSDARARIAPRLIESLYTEAMLLADEARTYFDQHGRDDRSELDPFVRVGFACESLKVTTRIMHIVAWLLTQRAIESGELSPGVEPRPERRLGHAADIDESLVVQLPPAAQRLVNASVDLYARVKRLDYERSDESSVPSPARALLGRLERDLRRSKGEAQ